MRRCGWCGSYTNTVVVLVYACGGQRHERPLCRDERRCVARRNKRRTA